LVVRGGPRDKGLRAKKAYIEERARSTKAIDRPSNTFKRRRDEPNEIFKNKMGEGSGGKARARQFLRGPPSGQSPTAIKTLARSPLLDS
jgi:hypothetical protein